MITQSFMNLIMNGGVILGNGVIYNIQRYSIHDGPGIRTTVFLKGCPLNCWWCHNPESQNINEDIMFIKNRCTLCGQCIRICPGNALELFDGEIMLDPSKCTACKKCADACPSRARETAGKRVDTEYVMKEIKKDLIFYDEAGGGVTFSGGEPLMQPKFLRELLMKCRDEGIHTAIDTSGFSQWEVIEGLLDFTDLFLYDIKLMDNEKHKKYTGVSNALILDNLKRLSSLGKEIYARLPVIPGINDDEGNIRAAGEFLSRHGIIRVNILPYHSIGRDKYIRLGRSYSLGDLAEPGEGEILKIKNILESYGLKVKIGG